MSTIFTLAANQNRKLSKPPNNKVTIINVTSEHQGKIYTYLHKVTTGDSIGLPDIQNIVPNKELTYRIDSEGYGFVSFIFKSDCPTATVKVKVKHMSEANSVTLFDSTGKGITTTNGALNVAISNATLNVDISMQDNIVVYGKTRTGQIRAILVDDEGRVITSSEQVNKQAKEVEDNEYAMIQVKTKNLVLPKNTTLLHDGPIGQGGSTDYHDSKDALLTTITGISDGETELTIAISPNKSLDIHIRKIISFGGPFYYTLETGTRYLKLISSNAVNLKAYASSK